MNGSFEKVCADILAMNKAELKSRLLRFHGKPKLDFTEDFLEQQPLDKLRHILFSVIVTDMRKQA
jgi:hypothetical protein